jgi:nicotinamide mononucleotide transporter
METFLQQIAASGPLDWFALVTSLAYVWLAARDNNWCWFFAAGSTAVWSYQSFFVYQLVSDGFLQLFYLAMAGVGLWRWRRAKAGGEKQGNKVPGLLDDDGRSDAVTTSIRSMSELDHILVITGSLLAGGLLYVFVSGLFTSASTLPDAITTTFSVATTFLLVYRRLENWLYWIAIDAVYIFIYLKTGAVLFALMMVINIGMAIYGYLHWRREMRTTNTV